MRYDMISMVKTSGMLDPPSFHFSPSCHTLSNALAISHVFFQADGNTWKRKEALMIPAINTILKYEISLIRFRSGAFRLYMFFNISRTTSRLTRLMEEEVVKENEILESRGNSRWTVL